MKRALTLAAIAACSGCGSDEPRPQAEAGGAAAVDSGEGGSASCAALDEESCKKAQATGHCAPTYGWKVPGGAKEYAGCTEELACDLVISCGVSPAGECWKFPDSCVPSGWSAIFECYQGPPACDEALDGGS